MVHMLTETESEALLILFRHLGRDYNANSLSRQMMVSPRGALKIVRRLEGKGLVVGRQFGRAVFYRPNDDEAASRLLALLLLLEARQKAARWLAEFSEMRKLTDILVLFGSMTTNPEAANDIDLLAVFPERREGSVDREVERRRMLSTRPLHLVKQGPEDFRRNLLKADKVLLDIIRTGIVLQGHDAFVKAVLDVSLSFHGGLVPAEEQARPSQDGAKHRGG